METSQKKYNFTIMTNKNKQTINLKWPYKTKNYVLFAAGLFVIIVGYLTMYLGEVNSFQSLVLSPLLLLIGYLVLIPYALFTKK